MKVVTSFFFAENVGGIHGESDAFQSKVEEDVPVKVYVYLEEILPNIAKGKFNFNFKIMAKPCAQSLNKSLAL